MSEPESHPKRSKNALALLALGALGVVYGDIGTSPLYAIREMFYGHGMRGFTQDDVLRQMSVVVWALTVIVAIKYIVFVLRADNDGEGGVFALYGLLHAKVRKGFGAFVGILLLFAAGLLFGDGIITPAISVLSAVEGLTVVTQSLTPYIIPITVAILFGLFFVQKQGTAKIGTFFGPIMIVWFLSIAAIGVPYIFAHPLILSVFNPWYAYDFFAMNNLSVIVRVLGSVMLVVTGGEALYADLGHFGKEPIRWSWFTVAYPALILNYLGQGAYLLSGAPVVADNLFFSLVPAPFLVPMVILATLATIIASQALISGAFSLTMQAVALGMLPYQAYKNTHRAHEGQVYVPFINWALFVGSVCFVLGFGSSAKLASAYGLAVAGVMAVTTLGMMAIARLYWNWPKIAAGVVFGLFLLVDATFLVANSFKFTEGGYIPVVIAGLFAFIFLTWRWGRDHIAYAYEAYPVSLMKELIEEKESHVPVHANAAILLTPKFISSKKDSAPLIKQIFIDRYGSLPRHVILLRVNKLRIPYARGARYEVVNLYNTERFGSITSVCVNFGFMEDHNIERVLDGIAKHKEVPLSEKHDEWVVHVVQPMLHLKRGASVWTWFRYSVFKLLHRISDTPMNYFRLGENEPLSVDYLPVYIS